MSDIVTLTAELREEHGKGASRALRIRGMVPAIIYGAGKEPLSVAISEKEITKYYRKPQFISQVFELEVGGKKHKVLPKDVQLHPVKDNVRHVDFVFLEKDMQKMLVPMVYKNKENCIGVKRGGYFNTVRRALPVLCPVSDLPRKIEIDVADMAVGTSIKAKEAPLPKGAKLLEKPDFVIASIIGKRGKTAVEEEAGEGGEGAEEGAEGTAGS